MWKVAASLLLTFSLTHIMTAQASVGQVSSLKLLAPGVGWAATTKKVFWTTDNGSHWTDITPKSSLDPQPTVASVFFLNSSDGWVLFAFEGPKDNGARFELMSTVDSGESWVVNSFKLPDTQRFIGLSPGGQVTFADTQHGWVGLGYQGLLPNGILLATNDGGSTWGEIDSPHSGAMSLSFVNTLNGWAIGGQSDEVWFTNNGGGKWRQLVSLDAAQKPEKSDPPKYDSPIFETATRGYLVARYVEFAKDRTSLALFVTTDGGQNWKLAARHLFGSSAGPFAPSTVVGSTWVIPYYLDKKISLTLVEIGGVGGPTEKTFEANAFGKAFFGNTEAKADLGEVEGLSFLDQSHGWLLVTSTPEGLHSWGTSLIATTDGGTSWVDVTPPDALQHWPGMPVTVKVPKHAHQAATPSGPTTAISTHRGFDIAYVTTPANMLTWWKYSPYHDTTIYLPAPNKNPKDPNLNRSWVSSVASQGWGFIPIWVGLQPPCAMQKGLASFSSNPSDAQAQGASEANSAIAQAAALGSNVGIIYKDIENYTTGVGPVGCSPAVVAFLTGWVTALHSTVPTVQAGVYGNPGPAEADFVRVSPNPDDAWIAKQDSRITTWGLGTLSDDYWTTHQRMHQYAGSPKHCGYSETYGGVALCIDADIDDATIFANTGLKPVSSYTFMDINLSPDFTEVLGINNSYPGPAQLVGYYQPPPVGNCTPYFGFLYSNGNFTQLNPPGNMCNLSLASGINDSGTVVGHYVLAANTTNAYLYNGGYTDISYPGAKETIFPAINDDGQVSGTENQTGIGTDYGYFDNGGFFVTFLFPGDGDSHAEAINGDAQILACCHDSFPYYCYIYDQGVFTDLAPEHIASCLGINNNNQIVANGNNLYDLTNGNVASLPSDPNAPSNYTGYYAVNDLGQMPCAYEAPSLAQVGCLAIPNP